MQGKTVECSCLAVIAEHGKHETYAQHLQDFAYIEAVMRAGSIRRAAMTGGENTGSWNAGACGSRVAPFALNPVAVYGVAYLVQRSILMATL